MFERPLVTFEFDSRAGEGLALAHALAPRAREIGAVLRVPCGATFSLGGVDLAKLELDLGRADAVRAALEASSMERGVRLTGDVVPGIEPGDLAESIERFRPDVLIFGGFRTVDAASVVGSALASARRYRIPAAVGVGGSESITRLVVPFDGHASSLARLGPFLRDRLTPAHRVTLVAVGSVGSIDPGLTASLDSVETITGTRASIELAPVPESLVERTASIARAFGEREADLLVVSTGFGVGAGPDLARTILLRALAAGRAPVLFVPEPDDGPATRAPDLDAFDTIGSGDARVRLEHLSALGPPTALRPSSIDVIADGKVLARIEARDGEIRIPAPIQGPVGLGRHAPGRDPIHAVETAIEVVRAPSSRIAMFDSRIADAELAAIAAELGRPDRLLVAVRVVPDESARSIRKRLRIAGFGRALVVDVRDVLDEGESTDVPIEVAGVRLARAGTEWRARGLAVDAVVTLGATRARATGCAVLASGSLDGADERARASYTDASARDESSRLDARTGSREITGNTVSVLLDNALALRSMIELVEHARERIHAQWYIVEDDEVGRALGAALARAAERGVAIRVVVDSLYSLHASFGATNPLLERWSAIAGIEVRASNPIAGVPSLEELKQRDHRKLVVVDGAVGLVSGRNLGNTYYRSFEEVALDLSSKWRDVPWFDAGAKVRGPVVAELDRAFLDAWARAGGAPFPIAPCPPAGDVTVRFVVHRGLEDAYTLEAYLALIERARERLVVVNSFPLQLELQHAMLRAVARGVRVTMLVGHVRPVYGHGVPFVGGSYRALADALVRARIAALLEAGADVRELRVEPLPGWAEELGAVHPFVHAKLLFADGLSVAVGSANLDVTAGYWESEALVVVDDPGVAGSVERQLADWLARSIRIDPDAASFREHAGLRQWLARVWPTILG